MLPLEACSLSTADQWHLFKSVLLTCKYFPRDRARVEFHSLPANLQAHWLGVGIATYLNDGHIEQLDAVAAALTLRSPDEAWNLIEKL